MERRERKNARKQGGVTKHAALRSRVRALLLRYRSDAVALDVAQDRFDNTDAELRATLDYFLKEGGTLAELNTEIAWVKENF